MLRRLVGCSLTAVNLELELSIWNLSAGIRFPTSSSHHIPSHQSKVQLFVSELAVFGAVEIECCLCVNSAFGIIGEVSLDSFLASEIVLDLADFMMQERP